MMNCIFFKFQKFLSLECVSKGDFSMFFFSFLKMLEKFHTLSCEAFFGFDDFFKIKEVDIISTGFPQDFRFQKWGDLSRFEEIFCGFWGKNRQYMRRFLEKMRFYKKKSLKVSRNNKFYILTNIQRLLKKNIL